MDDWCFDFFIAAFVFFSISLEAFFLSTSFFLSSDKPLTFSSESSILSSSEQLSLSYSLRVTKTEEKYPEIRFYMQINQLKWNLDVRPGKWFFPKWMKDFWENVHMIDFHSKFQKFCTGQTVEKQAILIKLYRSLHKYFDQ